MAFGDRPLSPLVEQQREKEAFQATIIALAGTVTGSKGRGYLNYQAWPNGTPGQAWNMGRVQERANVPVWIGYFKDEPVILHIDRSRLEPNGARGYRSPLFSLHAPDHGWGSGDPDYVDTRQIKDLMVKPAGGLTVKALPGWFTYDGVDLYFPGQKGIDLSDLQPAATGVKRGVGLYLDADKTVKLIGGNQVARTAGNLPEPVWPTGAFKLVVVILYGDKDFVDFEDVKQRKRIWAGGGETWPFTNVIPVNTEVELLAAIAAAGSSDLILLDNDITVTNTIDIGVSVNIGSFGAIDGRTIYKSTGRIFRIADIAPSGRVQFLNLSIRGGFTGTATDLVYIENANVDFLNARIYSEGMGDADACLVKILSDVVGVARQVTFTNTTVICTDPISSGYGVIITDTAADLGTHVIVQGGEVEAPDYEFRVDGSAATLALLFPITGGSIELLNGGTWEGRYFLADGTILPIDARVQVTAADTAEGYLDDKIGVGSNLSATVVDTGSGVEQLILDVPDSSTTVKGAVELATQAEVDAGTDTARAITPATLTGSPRALACEGRLTLTSGTAVTTADVTAATTIYFTPYHGNRIALYTGSIWLYYAFTEKSLSLSGFTANKNSDLFMYNNAGTLTLERVEWTNDTTRATALVLQDGILVKSGATTRRYLGTFRTTASTGQCEDSITKRYVWNYYNRVQKALQKSDTTGHTYDSTTVRAFNGDASGTASALFVVGVVENVFNLGINASLTRVSGDSNMLIGVGVNTNTAHSFSGTWATIGTINGHLVDNFTYPQTGLNELWITESGTNTGTDPTFNNAVVKAMIKC